MVIERRLAHGWIGALPASNQRCAPAGLLFPEHRRRRQHPAPQGGGNGLRSDHAGSGAASSGSPSYAIEGAMDEASRVSLLPFAP